MSAHSYQSRFVALSLFWLHSNILTNSTSSRDLVVFIDYGLSFRDHFYSMVAKDRMWASQILRCFLSHDPYILFRAFNVFVQPLVKYCSSLRSPTAVDLINKLNQCRGGLQS